MGSSDMLKHAQDMQATSNYTAFVGRTRSKLEHGSILTTLETYHVKAAIPPLQCHTSPAKFFASALDL